ncbi:MAG: hypothetical protein JNJ83_03135 [Verrucomicrobiaceae bacterium]|nr:hypothetical protein [Verrucomicrobiaceae bacterium]
MKANLPIPSFSALYWKEGLLRGCVTAIGLAVMIAVGIPWASQPQPGVPPLENVIEMQKMAKWAPLLGAVIGTVALLILVTRYLRIRSILTDGIIVKGKVDKIETYERRTDSRTVTSTPSYSRSYWATMSYNVNGTPHQVCQKLPYSPSTDGALEGKEIELVVLESAPTKPLIKNVYAVRPSIRK